MDVWYPLGLIVNQQRYRPSEYKLTAIVLDIAGHRLFKPVGIKKDEIDKRSFLNLSFANKGLHGINLGNKYLSSQIRKI